MEDGYYKHKSQSYIIKVNSNDNTFKHINPENASNDLAKQMESVRIYMALDNPNNWKRLTEKEVFLESV